MKASYLLPLSIVIGCIILFFALVQSSKTERYQYIEPNVVFDKSEGTLYYTDKKQYLDKKGDLYEYE